MIQIPFAIMFVVDYVLTYLEIFAGLGCEGNPFMVWFFELNFRTGVLTRIAWCCIINLGLWMCRKHPWYKPAVISVTILNGMVMVWHVIALFIIGI